jgi:hypothetical protein
LRACFLRRAADFSLGIRGKAVAQYISKVSFEISQHIENIDRKG